MKLSNTIIKAYEGETELLQSLIAECNNIAEKKHLEDKLKQVNAILSLIR